MGQMMVRAIPDDVLARFKARAKQEGLSAEAMARRLIMLEAVKPAQFSREEALRRIDELRAMTPKGAVSDSTAILREARDNGYPDLDD